MTQPDEPPAAAQDNLPVGLINQGYQRRLQGDLQGAIAMYRQAAALPQAPAAAHFNLGNALLDSGDAPAAQLPLRQALALDPAMSAAAMQLARCAVQIDKHNIGLRRFHGQAFNTLQALGQTHCQHMVIGQAINMVVQRMQGGSR
jgi:tetratricopeptide (TPR) repeat protein